MAHAGKKTGKGPKKARGAQGRSKKPAAPSGSSSTAKKADIRKTADPGLDLEMVDAVAAAAESHDLAELSVSWPGGGVTIVRESAAPAVPQSLAPVGSPPPASPQGSAGPAPLDPAHYTVVPSPLAGVFYRSPRPGAEPFVQVGDEVEPGQTLCIIEAMKLLNEITAEIPARVAAILVDSGLVVEPNQPLLYLDPL